MPTARAFVITAAMLAPLPAWAQTAPSGTAPPVREGNVWGNVSHQPTESEVRAQEKAAGLLGSAQQQRQQADELEQLDRQVLQRAQQGTNDGVMNGTEATKPLPP